MTSQLKQRAILFLIIATLVGVSFQSGVRSQLGPVVTSIVPDLPVDADWEPLRQTWVEIDEKFVGSATSTSNQDKVYGAIAGLVRSLGDPYSEFLPPVDNKQFAEEIKGEFGGVGIEVGVRESNLTIIAPLPGTPAARAGLQSGDKIVAINDQLTAELTISGAIELIRGEVGTVVTLLIARDKTEQEYKLQRAIINVPTLETELRSDRIFVIRLFNFGGTASELFRTALRDFVRAKSDKLIIDLRGNPGGYLQVAVDIASWFLPAGQVVAVEKNGRDEETKLYKSRGYNIFKDQLKLVILVDGGSASAAEILAGALRDHRRAVLIGEKTFGKGSVQQLIPITPDTSLKLTVAKWLTPKGVSISHDGLEPDIVVKRSDPSADGEEKDLILEKAVQFLLE